jgi:hypothetical protein
VGTRLVCNGPGDEHHRSRERHAGVPQPVDNATSEITSAPMYLILVNQAQATGTVYTGMMMVDYVRVWQ